MWTFDVVAPRLSLDPPLQDLKAAILAGRQRPQSISFSLIDFLAFGPRLEGHWGPLHAGVPEFFAALSRGSWDATLHQSVPTSLLGDFGEFFGALAFQTSLAPQSRIARVLRASWLKRPDFIVLDASAQRLTALECKAGAVNARRARSTTPIGQRASVNWCSRMQVRRDAGLTQIASDVVRGQV